jgi:hypothetical protein
VRERRVDRDRVAGSIMRLTEARRGVTDACCRARGPCGPALAVSVASVPPSHAWRSTASPDRSGPPRGYPGCRRSVEFHVDQPSDWAHRRAAVAGDSVTGNTEPAGLLDQWPGKLGAFPAPIDELARPRRPRSRECVTSSPAPPGRAGRRCGRRRCPASAPHRSPSQARKSDTRWTTSRRGVRPRRHARPHRRGRSPRPCGDNGRGALFCGSRRRDQPCTAPPAPTSPGPRWCTCATGKGPIPLDLQIWRRELMAQLWNPARSSDGKPFAPVRAARLGSDPRHCL